MKALMLKLLALFGALMLIVIILGVVTAIRGFDETRGGYEPPYTDFTGEPIDWSPLDRGPEGFVKRCHVIDVLLHCGTGMISLSLFGLEWQWRQLSPCA
ncbi:MAG: hypothetical protein R3229_14830 [Alphaproteobacteria bacterium]|nr:hypothetical protein [Alphaproteobacteria bacterium]